VISPHVAIIGGGISGLAAAYQLTQLGVPFVLLERAPRCGGVVLTERVDGYTIDAGPDALLTQKPAAVELCRELGLGARLQSQAARETYVVRNGRLCRLPHASVLGIPTEWRPFITTDAFSWFGKLRMAADILIPMRSVDTDESIAGFIGRRFGHEAVEYLAEPLLAGIHGGDPTKLSMRAAFPRFLELERRSRSVILGLRGLPARVGAPGASPFVALPGGMRELSDALIGRLPTPAVRTGIGVESVAPSRAAFTLQLSNGERLSVSSLVVATPPAATSRIVAPIDERLANLCGRVSSASVVTVALGFARSAVRHPLNGSGFVVPRREGLRIRAASWVSSKWQGRAPEGRVLLRAYLGGATEPAVVDLDDSSLIAAAHGDMTRLLGIVGEPELTRVYRWRNATPQLEVGHVALMQAIDERLAEYPGLFLAGSGFRGTGIADCIADARRQAARASATLLPALTA
jgi:oxygen-dependent protoporphyrinogen oxidase